MRRDIILTIIAMTLSTGLIQAQKATDELNLKIEAGETIHFTRTGYDSGYETLESSIRLQGSYFGFLGGMGIDFPLSGDPGAMDISLKIGYGTSWEITELEVFGFLQRGINRKPENLTLGGIGVTGRISITGPLQAFAEFRSMSPFFSDATRRYSYRAYDMEACLTFGLNLSW